MRTPKYPQASVPLAGHDGNAFAIMGRVADAMRDAGIDNDAINEFRREAMSGDYDNLLRTVIDTVTVEDFDD